MFDFLNRTFAIGGCVLLCIACSAQLQAQTIGSAGTISGRVLDPSGTVVPGGTVSIKNDLTGVVTTASTDAMGRFSAPGLPVGNYTIEVGVPGFKTARSSGLLLTASGLENVDIPLSVAPVTTEVTVSEFVPLAATLAPSQSSLDTHSAESVISPEYIDNFTAPTADFGEILQMAPGTFAASSNGPGLGQYKTFFRGFKDGMYTMTFDGIPFEDTNDPTHHTWAFFPAQFIGQTLFDRSPGTASTIGPTNFGGSINMMSRTLRPNTNIRATASYGSFNTKLFEAAADTGQFGPGGKMSMVFDVLQLRSDGYLSYNFLKRNAFSAKYQYRVTPKTTITAFTSLNELKSNTPDTTAATRAQIAQHGDRYLLVNDPTQGNYYGYNYYHIPSDFDYAGVSSDVGHGWLIDTKVYTYRYYNKQFLDKNFAAPGPTSAVDKLNSYRRWGNLFVAAKNMNFGTFRMGMWSERANTYRFQYPSDPRSWFDTPLPNFKERFYTTSLQPYGEFEWRPINRLTLTPGVKFVFYRMSLTQYADNGKTVGNLNGAASVDHTADYHTWQPTFDVNYKLKNNWAVYTQFAAGSQIPPSAIFDVTGAQVGVLPSPAKNMTYQAGTVYKTGRFTLDFDAYHIGFDSTYSSFTGPDALPHYYLGGSSTTKGIEMESTIFLGAGLSLYLNGTEGSAKYDATGLYIANAPGNTETAGLSFQQRNWDLGFFNKRISNMWNDNGPINQAVRIDPFEITNLYLNYTIKGESRFAETKFRLIFNNLFDQHNVFMVEPASTKSNAPAPGDLLHKLAGRSVAMSVTFGLSPGNK
jgi:iron complex outermembrane receptor protein